MWKLSDRQRNLRQFAILGLGAVRIVMHETKARIANKEDVRPIKKEFRKFFSGDRKKKQIVTRDGKVVLFTCK